MQVLANVDVDDLEKAIAFYTGALDLRLGRRLFNNAVAELLGGMVTIYLLAKPAGSAATANSSLRRDYRRRRRETGSGIQTFAWGLLATLSDPFGHGFCLLERKK